MEDYVVEVLATAPIIIAIVVLFLAGAIVAGVIYSKKIEDAEDLALAGRSLSLPYVVSSVVATYICAGVVIGVAGQAYGAGFQGIVFDPFSIALITFPLVAIFFAYPLRQGRYITVVDYYSSRFSPAMGSIHLIVQTISIIAWFGGQLTAFGILIHLTTGFDLTTAVIIATLVTIIVTYTGGLWALSRIDLVAVFCLIIFLLISLPIVIGQVGGFSTFFATAENFAELPTFALWPVAAEDGGYLWYSGMHGILYYIAAWIISIAALNCPVLLQRTLAAKNVSVARKSFGLSAILYLAIGVIPAFIGIAAYTYGINLPVEDQEMVFPLVAELFLPPWLAVAVIVTLMIAIISTVGDSILTAATIFGHNVYGFFKPKATSQEKLKIMRILIPIIAIVGMIIALLLSTVYRLIIFAGGVVLVTVSIQYVLGFYWKKVNNYGALVSFAVGVTTWIAFIFVFLPTTMEANTGILVEGEVYMDWALWDAIFMSYLPAFIAAIVSCVAVSLLTQKQDPPKPLRDVDGNLIERKGLSFHTLKGKDSKVG